VDSGAISLSEQEVHEMSTPLPPRSPRPGRLGMARQATHGTLAMQLRGIERQAGVRRTL
jgi:hypothetical protein